MAELMKPGAGNGAEYEKYSFTQTLREVTVSIPVPKGTRGKQCKVEIRDEYVKVSVLGEVVVEGKLTRAVKSADSLWCLEDGMLRLDLEKRKTGDWWGAVLEGDRQIDTAMCAAQAMNPGELDNETRALVEKMAFDQRQRQAGLPTSDEMERANILKKFQQEHPELDFSNAEIQ